MTDRELLEMAAKAAAFGSPNSRDFCWTESEYPVRSGKKGALWNYVGWGPDAELWNPLTDDGDALRLAVKLNLSADFFDDFIHVGYTPNDNEADQVKEASNPDPYAATRRAIVRAAAEIGRAMP